MPPRLATRRGLILSCSRPAGTIIRENTRQQIENGQDFCCLGPTPLDRDRLADHTPGVQDPQGEIDTQTGREPHSIRDS